VIDKKFVQPAEIRTYWGYVKPRLEIVLKKSPEPWIPEDIYADVVMGSSLLWLMLNEEQPAGFIVGRKQNDGVFFLWAGYCEPHIDDLIKWTLIEQATISVGCKKIAFESWRKGWEKKAKKLGFRPRKYIKELKI
tara:strand:- start:203 stop:607 length:405 start_codon:yes stop_codon:yes gene_type:complete